MIYEAGDLPVLVEKDVHGEIGGMRKLVGNYIVSVRKGLITPECDDNLGESQAVKAWPMRRRHKPQGHKPLADKIVNCRSATRKEWI